MKGDNYTKVQVGRKWKGNLFKINHNTRSRPLVVKECLSLSNYRTFGFISHQNLQPLFSKKSITGNK